MCQCDITFYQSESANETSNFKIGILIVLIIVFIKIRRSKNLIKGIIKRLSYQISQFFKLDLNKLYIA